MATRYWVGNGGDWSNTAHWATSSGGSSGASVPTSADDVVFDVNSFSVGGAVFNTDTAVCKSLTVNGVLNDPQFQIDNAQYGIFSGLAIYGSITLDNSMSFAGTDALSLLAMTTVTITSGGTTLPQLNFMQAGTGTFNIQDNLTISGTFNVGGSGAHINANGHDIYCSNLQQSTIGSAAFLNMGSGTWSFYDGGMFFFNIDNSHLTSSSAHIVIAPGNTFASIGLGAYDRTFASLTIQTTGQTTEIGNGAGGGPFTYTFGPLIVSGSGNTLLFEPTVSGDSNVYAFTSFNVTGGTPGHRNRIDTETVFGEYRQVDITATSTNLKYVKFHYINASGGAEWTAQRATDLGGNSGITFLPDGILPSYNPSLTSAIKVADQDMSVPNVIIGAQNGDEVPLYALLERSTTYEFSDFRSKVFVVGADFLVDEIRFSIAQPLADGMELIPVLYFDNMQRSAPGTPISLDNYEEGQTDFKLGPGNFDFDTHGNNDFFLELQHTGTVLCTVKLPVSIDADVDEIQ